MRFPLRRRRTQRRYKSIQASLNPSVFASDEIQNFQAEAMLPKQYESLQNAEQVIDETEKLAKREGS